MSERKERAIKKLCYCMSTENYWGYANQIEEEKKEKTFPQTDDLVVVLAWYPVPRYLWPIYIRCI